MSDKKMFKFILFNTNKDVDINDIVAEEIESRGYKKAVRSFQGKYPKLKNVYVTWDKEGVELNKLQKLPIGRKKKQ